MGQEVKSAFSLNKDKASDVKKGSLLAAPDQSELTGTKGAFGHLGLEDRIGVMAVSLRALQAKLSACSEDLNLKSPPHLHGEAASSPIQNSHLSPFKSEVRSNAELSAKQEQVERVWDSFQEDLLALSAEWEAGSKILRKEKVRAPSPAYSELLRPNSAARDLDSPQEVEEDALTSTNGSKPWRRSDSTTDSSDGPPDPPSGTSLYALRRLEGADGTSETLVPNGKFSTRDTDMDDEMSDLAQMLLNSTSPDHLPPPGLEQVFESIAGMADSSYGGGSDGSNLGLGKMTREERIKKAKEQRAKALIQQDAKRERANKEEAEGMEPAGMVRELKDVIKARRESRMLGQSVASPIPSPSIEPANASPSQLGSPLELGNTGAFASNSSSLASVLSARLASSSPQVQVQESPSTTTSKSRSRRSTEVASRNRQSVVMDNKVWRNSQDLLSGSNLNGMHSVPLQEGPIVPLKGST